ncbi:MAG TPA: deoxyribodipyrimidine photo-lyase [Cytophagaceae bacterium]|jgi:deoxyribodipyrimidine photo-lyase|nr:deoxyribodipyrimidine photo-lyase [Cytophagaceae bacterium]
MTKPEVVIFWFRRDLRLHDNAGLYYALKKEKAVLPLFIFDADILEDLQDKEDARVTFLYDQVKKIYDQLEAKGSSLLTAYGKPLEVYKILLKEYEIKAVYTNHDYEPYAIARDEAVRKLLVSENIKLHTFKDHVIFEKEEIVNETGNPYKVYTPYKNKWLAKANEFYLKSYPVEKYTRHFYKTSPFKFPSLEKIGFRRTKIALPPETVSQGLIRQYDKQRDYPFLDATSRLGIHFRFGTLSIREKAGKAKQLNEVWLSELIWRDFFSQLLYHFPQVVTEPFQEKFKKISWRTDQKDFQKWCEGKTGFPLVDAGMRELNATGFMHNRVRMVTASFLTKHLLIDWRWGEAYFAEKLLDYELASNNGNWQWCAGTGADAQPYFRIFNPITQQQKFDPDFIYIKKWLPEYGTEKYPPPMIDHKEATARAKQAFAVLSK